MLISLPLPSHYLPSLDGERRLKPYWKHEIWSLFISHWYSLCKITEDMECCPTPKSIHNQPCIVPYCISLVRNNTTTIPMKTPVLTQPSLPPHPPPPPLLFFFTIITGNTFVTSLSKLTQKTEKNRQQDKYTIQIFSSCSWRIHWMVQF